MATKLNKCFICSPPHEGDPQKMAIARRYCRDAVWDMMVPVAPNLSFAAFLDDADISDRWRKKTIVAALLPECSEFRVFCDEVTEDMIPEIKKAQELKIPIKFYDADMKEVDYDALIINKRIGPGYRKIIAEAHGDYSSGTICPYTAECWKSQTPNQDTVQKEPDPPAEVELQVVVGEVVEESSNIWHRLFHRINRR